MKISDFKERVLTTIYDLVDVYFGENDIIDSMVNSTLKLMINVNSNKLDEALKIFTNSEGEIDADTIVNAYANNIGDNGVSFNIKQYVKNDFIRNILPDKTLIISKEDILKIIKDASNNTLAPISTLPSQCS